MNPRIIFRLIAFFATIMLLAALIGWTAHTSWRRMGELQEHLSAQQWKSFQIADHLQQSILGLNNMVLRYAAYVIRKIGRILKRPARTLSRWIDEQQPIVSSKAERLLFDQIKVVFTRLSGAADAITRKNLRRPPAHRPRGGVH